MCCYKKRFNFRVVTVIVNSNNNCLLIPIKKSWQTIPERDSKSDRTRSRTRTSQHRINILSSRLFWDVTEKIGKHTPPFCHYIFTSFSCSRKNHEKITNIWSFWWNFQISRFLQGGVGQCFIAISLQICLESKSRDDRFFWPITGYTL